MILKKKKKAHEDTATGPVKKNSQLLPIFVHGSIYIYPAIPNDLASFEIPLKRKEKASFMIWPPVCIHSY